MFKELLGEPQVDASSQTEPPSRPKRKHKRTIAPQEPPQAPLSLTKSEPDEPRCTLADPKSYVLEMFDHYIEPKIVDDNALIQNMKRDIYRRAVGEIVAGELKNVGAVGSLTPDNILNLTLLSVRKAGLVV